MVLRSLASLADEPQPLALVELPVPVPRSGEILLRVAACGVCHTELDEVEGRAAPPVLPVVPGHQVVGRVAGAGAGVTRWRENDRVGVGWIHHSSGGPDENLSPAFCATGRDVDGGYAEYMTVPQDVWMEREIKSVANVTQHDIRAFLPLAAAIPIRPEVRVYPLEEANRALCELKQGRVRGSKVLRIGGREEMADGATRDGSSTRPPGAGQVPTPPATRRPDE